MKRLCVLVCALGFCAGCGSDGNKQQWEDFKKDWRGDNMQMRSDFSRTNDMDEHAVRAPSHE